MTSITIVVSAGSLFVALDGSDLDETVAAARCDNSIFHLSLSLAESLVGLTRQKKSCMFATAPVSLPLSLGRCLTWSVIDCDVKGNGMDGVIILVWITFEFPTVTHNMVHETQSQYEDGSLRELSMRVW